DHARVHVYRRHVGIPWMRDQGNTACPETGIVLGARNLPAKFRRELPMDGGGMNPNLLENPAAHDRHDAAAALAILTLPGRLLEASRLPWGLRACQFVLDRLECGADAIAQGFEPCSRLFLLFLDVGGQARWDIRSFQNASPFSDPRSTKDSSFAGWTPNLSLPWVKEFFRAHSVATAAGWLEEE